MRITKRLLKWNRHVTRLACLLAVCSLFYACKDEYILDEEMPKRLGTNLYDNLLQRGNFTNYLRLLSDPDINVKGATSMQEVLQRTGSKTLFVANDEAWNEFFRKNAGLPESNPWHNATSYANLSAAQKKLLLHSSMLNNSIVLENLASSQGSGNQAPIRGEYMRRNTDYEPTDTITFVPSEKMPQTHSLTDKDYWQYYRESGKGIWLATDNTENMMVTFTNEHMKKNAITDEDFARIMGVQRNSTDEVYVYDSRVVDPDNVSQNGYLNIMSKPLAPLPNMAEAIRNSGRTNIFSHMLDRFSAPFYDASLTRDYKVLHPEFKDDDSIFVRRYFTEHGNGMTEWLREPAPLGETQPYKPYKDDVDTSDFEPGVPSLKFDPGWNTYIGKDFKNNRTTGLHRDMAAMFVPNDEALRKFWSKASGADFIRTFGDRSSFDDTRDGLVFHEGELGMYKNMDMVPLDRIAKIINLIMQPSFINSVPSKMTRLRDDALEQLFYETDVKDSIDTCMVACNGAVYIMKAVYGPADFTSVIAPANISKDSKIIKWAIYDEKEMKLNYYAYLKAMQSRFTFFLPTDEAMGYYYDPMSFRSSYPRAIKFKSKNLATDQMPIGADLYAYGSGKNEDWINNGAIASSPLKNDNINNDDIKNRLRDILESHTIVHDGTNDIHGIDEYFLSKNGNAIKVVRDDQNHIIEALGTLQIETQRDAEESGRIMEENPGVLTCKVTKPSEGLKNGQTYVLNAPLVPTYRSVYSIFTNKNKNFDRLEKEEAYEESPYAAFYNLTLGINQTIIERCGLIKSSQTAANKTLQMAKYEIFQKSGGSGQNKWYCMDKNVGFFNNYHYTAFVPTNDAVDRAVENGLPTWESIAADFESRCKMTPESVDEVTGDTTWVLSDTLATAADSAIIAAQITYLTNFIRYHFADNTMFADHSAVAEDGAGEMITSCYDHETGLFLKIFAHRDETMKDETPELYIRDAAAKKSEKQAMRTVTGKVNGKEVENIFARDVVSNKDISQTMRGAQMKSSSTAVIHLIPEVLNHIDLKGGRHDQAWQTASGARKYVKRYAIEK